MSIEPYVYPPIDQEESARRLEEHRANLACRDGMEEIIRSGFDGAHLDNDCARKAIEEFGLQRVELVLAGTVQDRSWDGRFSKQTREWASHRTLPPMERCSGYILHAHSVVVDGFVRQYLQAVAEMAREAIEEVEGQEQSFPGMTL